MADKLGAEFMREFNDYSDEQKIECLFNPETTNAKIDDMHKDIYFNICTV